MHSQPHPILERRVEDTEYDLIMKAKQPTAARNPTSRGWWWMWSALLGGAIVLAVVVLAEMSSGS